MTDKDPTLMNRMETGMVENLRKKESVSLVNQSVANKTLDARFLGLTDKQVFHFWNSLVIFDAFGKLFLISLNLLGRYTIKKGILSIYSTAYPALALACLYAYYFYGDEK